MSSDMLRTESGYQTYSKNLLRLYDAFVLNFSSSYLWRCEREHCLQHYNTHVSNNHLDVGVGTGYFLDRCRFPSEAPRLGLMDPNRNCLEVTANKLARYRPERYEWDIFDPVVNPMKTKLGSFDSIGLNYVLHCLPGNFEHKETAISNLKQVLHPAGKLFGSTILGNRPMSLPARSLMGLYNDKGIFSNRGDTESGLRAMLAGQFKHSRVNVIGCVALFVASDETKV